MLFFSCGTCGWSLLSQNLPYLEFWVWLLIPAFGLYYWQNAKLGYKGLSLVEGLIVLMIGAVASAIMFASIVFPVAFACALLLTGYRVIRVNEWSIRISSLALLAGFALTALWGMHERQRLGPDYGLSRFQAGGPGQSFFARTASDPGLDVQHYLEILASGTARQAHNVESVLVMRPHKLNDSERDKELQLCQAGLSNCPEPRKIQLQNIIKAYSDKRDTQPKSPVP